MNQIKEYNETTFENIKHIDEYGNEYWLARELQKALKYKEWRNFELVINKAKKACENSILICLNVLLISTKHQKCLMVV